MRHDQIKHRNDFDIVEIATNEDPASVTLAEMELGGKFCSEAAAPDLPPAVGRLLLSGIAEARSIGPHRVAID